MSFVKLFLILIRIFYAVSIRNSIILSDENNGGGKFTTETNNFSTSFLLDDHDFTLLNDLNFFKRRNRLPPPPQLSHTEDFEIVQFITLNAKRKSPINHQTQVNPNDGKNAFLSKSREYGDVHEGVSIKLIFTGDRRRHLNEETGENPPYLILDLTKRNSGEWIPSTYHETIYTSDDDTSTKTESIKNNNTRYVFDCFYQGTIRGIPKSWILLDDCENRNHFTGYLYDGLTDKQYYLEPSFPTIFNDDATKDLLNLGLHKLWPVTAAHAAYHQTRLNPLNGNSTDAASGGIQDIQQCHIPNINPIPDTTSTNNVRPDDLKEYSYKIRKKRDLKLPESQGPSPLVIELYVVNDYAQYVKWGKDERKVILRTLQISHILNAIFKQLNIVVALVGTEVWTSGDRIKMSTDGDTTLKAFNKYRQTSILRAVPHDNAQLLTANYFDGGVIGKAIKRQICAYSDSTGVAMDHNNMVGPVASTMAHELGHSLGMDHDTEICDCPDRVCVMTPASGSFLATKWSSCSLQYLSYSIARGMDTCLQNVPPKVLDTPKCGNGFLEPGEECDCGLPQYCQNKCCNATTCRLTVNSTCATGSCCNFYTCQVRPRASMCRSAVGPCDLPEYCDGRAEFCPIDVKVRDGTPCPTRATHAKIYGGDAAALGIGFGFKKFIVNDDGGSGVSHQSNNPETYSRKRPQSNNYFDAQRIAASSPALAYPKDQRLEFWGDQDDSTTHYGQDDYYEGDASVAKTPPAAARPPHDRKISTNTRGGDKSNNNKVGNYKSTPAIPKTATTIGTKIRGAIDENLGKFKMVYGRGHCFSGYCNSYSAQCKLLWGPAAKMAVPTCYKQNVFSAAPVPIAAPPSGTNAVRRDGDCGYDIQTGIHKSCPKDDYMCGRLHCVTDDDLLIYGETSGHKKWHSYVRYESLNEDGRGAFKRSLRYWSCHSAFIDLGFQVPDTGLVPDGASCDIDKMCVNQSCIHKNEINVKRCPKRCSGKGICNSNGRCHCFFGYGPPYCDKPGPGGSLDSGPPANVRRMKPLIKALLVVFLCLVPIICVFSFGLYKCLFNSTNAKKKAASFNYGRGDGNGSSRVKGISPNLFSRAFRDIIYLIRCRQSRYDGTDKLNRTASKKYLSATNYTTAILNPITNDLGFSNHKGGAEPSSNVSEVLTANSIQHANTLLNTDVLTDWPLSDRPRLGFKNSSKPAILKGSSSATVLKNSVKLNTALDLSIHQPTRPAPPPPNEPYRAAALFIRNTPDVFSKSDLYIRKIKKNPSPEDPKKGIDDFRQIGNSVKTSQKPSYFAPNQANERSLEKSNNKKPSKRSGVKRVESLNKNSITTSRPMVEPPKPPNNLSNGTSSTITTDSKFHPPINSPVVPLYQNVKLPSSSSHHMEGKAEESMRNALPLPPRKVTRAPTIPEPTTIEQIPKDAVQQLSRHESTVSQLTKRFEKHGP